MPDDRYGPVSTSSAPSTGLGNGVSARPSARADETATAAPATAITAPTTETSAPCPEGQPGRDDDRRDDEHDERELGDDPAAAAPLSQAR